MSVQVMKRNDSDNIRLTATFQKVESNTVSKGQHPAEPQTSSCKLSRLIPHDCIIGDPEDLVHMDWLAEIPREYSDSNL